MIRDLLLDSNLLLLLVIGLMDRRLIPRYNRTSQFTPEQFDALARIVHRARRVVTTPHILTEVSNLANGLSEEQRRAFANYYRSVIAALVEQFTTAHELSGSHLFHFGLTDSAILNIAGDTLVLTQDGRLAAQIVSAGRFALDLQSAINLGSEI